MVYCSKCGHSNPDGTEQCAQCNEPLAVSSAPKRKREMEDECFGVPRGGTIFGISGRWIGGMGMFLLCVGTVGVFAGTRASPFGIMGAVLLTIPVMLLASYYGLWPLAIIALVTTVAVWLLMWILWLRGT